MFCVAFMLIAMMVDNKGISGAFLALAMLCDTAVLITYMLLTL